MPVELQAVPSVLDRIIADDDQAEPSTNVRLRKIIEAVVHDIQLLLNAPQWMRYKEWARDGENEGRGELQDSLAAYGLPDFSAYNRSAEARRQLRLAIEDVINRFEPRLEFVRVIEEGNNDFITRFRMEARLKVEGEDQFVPFESELQLEHGNISIQSK